MNLDIQALIDKYGPVVVAAAQRQVQVAVIEDVLYFVAGLPIAFFAVRAALAAWRGFTSGNFDQEGRAILLTIASVVLGIVAIWFIIGGGGEALTFSLNPTWATIKMITGLIK